MALAGLGASVVAAAPAHAAGQSCTYGSSSGNVLICLDDNDTNVISATATAQYSGRVLQACVHGPGDVRLACSAYVYEPPGGTVREYYSTSGPLRGTYCADGWKQQPDGSTVNLGETCQNL